MLANIFGGQGLTVRDYGFFLLWSVAGNAADGVVFLALLKYSHVMHRGETPEPAKVSEP